jgi:MFS family permease
MFGCSLVALVPATLGIVLAPLEEAFGWSRATVSSTVFIIAVLALIIAPVAGRLIARWGPRRVALTSTMLSAFGFLAFAGAGGSEWTWWAASACLGLLSAAGGPIVWTTGVTRTFDRHRGLAMAVVLSGSGLAFMTVPIAALAILKAFGWQAIFLLFAALAVFLYFPLTWLWFAREPSSASPHLPAAAPAAPGKQEDRSAMMTIHFWLMALFVILVGAVEGALTVHLFPILKEGGIEATTAAAVISGFGIALAAARLLSGVLLDKIAAPLVMGLVIIGLAVSNLIAWQGATTLTGALAITLTLGFGCGGTTSSLAVLISRYFAASTYASVFGVLISTLGLCYGLAPMLAAHVHKLTGSYVALFPVFLGMLAGAAIILIVFAQKSKG